MKRFLWRTLRYLPALCAIACLFLLASLANAAQVLYLVSPRSSPQTDHQIEVASRFYGLAIHRETVRTSKDAARGQSSHT